MPVFYASLCHPLKPPMYLIYAQPHNPPPSWYLLLSSRFFPFPHYICQFEGFFPNSAFQYCSSYFSSDLPILWPFHWILISMTSFQGVLFPFFHIYIFCCIISDSLLALFTSSTVSVRKLSMATPNIFQALLFSWALNSPVFLLSVSLSSACKIAFVSDLYT